MGIIRGLKRESPYIIRVFSRFLVALWSREINVALMFVYGLFSPMAEIIVFPSYTDKIFEFFRVINKLAFSLRADRR